ncbi:hypothetical protein [Pectobacterium phage PcCB7V]|nr:hypothetical protein [Pectobacterium phage PcCB7V]
MKSLTTEGQDEFTNYWKGQNKKLLINTLWEYLLVMESQAQEIARLQKQATQSNSAYLSHCRSVGGVTLPPGM